MVKVISKGDADGDGDGDGDGDEWVKEFLYEMMFLQV